MKTKKVKKSAAGTTEKRLLKALDAVEKAAVPKEMRDADGGFATEGDGDELQVSASEDAEPKGVKKGGRRRSDEESDDDVEKADDEMSEESSDEESSEESSGSDDEESAPPMALSKKKGKGGKSTKKSVKKGKADSSSDDESSMETSEELSGEESIGESPKPVKKGKKGKSIKKSHNGHTIKKALLADEKNVELFNASEFIEQLVDSVSDSHAGLTKSVRAAREEQVNFNQTLAKGFMLLGQEVVENRREMRKLRKALANTPMVARGKTLLSKGDVQEREFEQPEGAEQMDDDTYRKSVDALVHLATNGKIKAELVTEFEMHKSLDVLPPAVREMIQGSLH